MLMIRMTIMMCRFLLHKAFSCEIVLLGVNATDAATDYGTDAGDNCKDIDEAGDHNHDHRTRHTVHLAKFSDFQVCMVNLTVNNLNAML